MIIKSFKATDKIKRSFIKVLPEGGQVTLATIAVVLSAAAVLAAAVGLLTFNEIKRLITL